jgi:hypothetical protein
VPDIFQLYIPPSGKLSKQKRKKAAEGQRRFKRRTRNPLTGELEERLGSDDGAQTQVDEADGADADDLKREVQAQVEALGEEEYNVSKSQDVKDDRSIQILDLHSQNPLISFRGSVYRCHWSTTLSTDMFFAKKPETATEEDGPPLRSFDKWDLLGLSSTRLIASEAKLVPKYREQSENRPSNNGEGEASEDVPQARFLRRFAQVQAKKGEIATDVDSSGDAITGNGNSTLRTAPEALKALFAGGTAVTTRGTNVATRTQATPSSSKAVAGSNPPSTSGVGASNDTQAT